MNREHILNIKMLIANGMTENALAEMHNFLNQFSNSDIYLNDTILISSRFNKLQKEIKNGVISHSEEIIAINKINLAFLDLLNQIEKVELTKKREFDNIKSKGRKQRNKNGEYLFVDTEMKFDMAVTYRMNNQYKLASRIFEEIILREPNCWPAYLHLGVCQMNLNYFNESITSFTKALSFDRMQKRINSYLAESYYKLGEATNIHEHYYASEKFCDSSEHLEIVKEIELKINKKLDKGWFRKILIKSSIVYPRPELPNWQMWKDFENSILEKKDTCNLCFTIKPKRCETCNACLQCQHRENEALCDDHAPSDHSGLLAS